MKVAVTGASGLIGSFIAKELLFLKHTPILLVREISNTHLLTSIISDCEVRVADILDILSLEKSLQDCDMVIHSAGKVSYDPRREKEIFSVNVEGTYNVVNTCLKFGIKKLIHISSIAAIGRNATDIHLNESNQWVDNHLNSTYAKSKYLAELEVFRGGEEGLNFSIVNPSIVLGPGDSTRSSTRLFTHVKKMPQFYPNGTLNVVDVRDVAKCTCALLYLEHPDRVILNGDTISYKEFYSFIREKKGVKGLFSSVPKLVIRIIAFFDMIYRFFKGGEPFVTKENLKFFNKKFVYNSLYYFSLFPDYSLIKARDSISWTLDNIKDHN